MEYTRAPPPSGPPPSYPIMNRMYRRNLRPVVLSIAIITALYSFVYAVGSFRSIRVDKEDNLSNFVVFSIVLGALYIAVCVFEIIGILAASTQRSPLARFYAHLSALSTVIILATGLLRIVVHFVYKNELLNECAIITSGTTVTFRFGLFGPSESDNIDPANAAQWCHDTWEHNSWTEIVSLIIELILGVFFTAVAYSYYRQLLDPSHPANALRAPSNQARAYAPSHYTPPYNPGAYNPSYAPPVGIPPGAAPAYERDEGYEHDGDTKAPGYGFSEEGHDEPFVGAEKEKDHDPFADYEVTGHNNGTKDGSSRV